MKLHKKEYLPQLRITEKQTVYVLMSLDKYQRASHIAELLEICLAYHMHTLCISLGVGWGRVSRVGVSEFLLL